LEGIALGDDTAQGSLGWLSAIPHPCAHIDDIWPKVVAVSGLSFLVKFHRKVREFISSICPLLAEIFERRPIGQHRGGRSWRTFKCRKEGDHFECRANHRQFGVEIYDSMKGRIGENASCFLRYVTREDNGKRLFDALPLSWTTADVIGQGWVVRSGLGAPQFIHAASNALVRKTTHGLLAVAPTFAFITHQVGERFPTHHFVCFACVQQRFHAVIPPVSCDFLASGSP
jgi:hypothetical protein